MTKHAEATIIKREAQLQPLLTSNARLSPSAMGTLDNPVEVAPARLCTCNHANERFRWKNWWAGSWSQIVH